MSAIFFGACMGATKMNHFSRILATIAIALSATACAAEPEYQTVAQQTRVADVMFGAYTYGGIWHGMDPVLNLESELGRRLDVVHWFMNWSHEWDPALLAPLAATGRMPMISWQSHNAPVRDIAAGHFDDYIRSWAEGAAAFDGRIYLRPFPEMNGSWTPWNGDPAGLVQAWQRIVDIFDRAGAHNVRWVWSPNVTDEPRTAGNAMEAYYPGSDYVDVLALDGYNWGDVREYIGWRSFEDIFAEGYDRVIALGSQPVWIAETASAEIGGNKGEWVQDMFTTHSFPALEAIVWFDEDKETDWRIGSSWNSLSSFQAVVPLLGADLAQAD